MCEKEDVDEGEKLKNTYKKCLRIGPTVTMTLLSDTQAIRERQKTAHILPFEIRCKGENHSKATNHRYAIVLYAFVALCTRLVRLNT